MIKKYFIPHSENDYKPHVFREASVIAILAIILFVFVSSTFVLPILKRSGLTASILSSVIVEDTNQNRQGSDLSTLAVNPLLEAAASAKAEDMALKGYFAHNSPEGLSSWYWFKKVGYPYVYAGENLAIDFSDSDQVVKAWMNSPGHRANILNDKYTEIGIGISEGYLEGRKTTFVVQMFGSRNINNTASAVAEYKPEPVAPPVKVQEPKQANPIVVAEAPKSDTKVQPLETKFVETKVSDWDSIHKETPAQEIVMASTFNVSWYEKLLANPSKNLRIIYFALMIFLVISLFLYIFIERRIQHPKNVGYGLLLLVIILILFGIHLLTLSPLAL